MTIPGHNLRVTHDSKHAPTLADSGPQITRPRRIRYQTAIVVLAEHAGQPHEKLLAYANRHYRRTLMPMAVMAFTGAGGSSHARRIREAIRLGREVYIYLWTGPASADSVETRAAFVRERFVLILGFEGGPDFPADSLDPFIDYIVDELARAVPPARDDRT